MRIVITGVCGLVGSNLARYVRQEYPYVEIIGIDNLSSGRRENLPEGVRLIPFTLGQSLLSCRQDVFDKPVDAVFHFAAYASECFSPFCRTYTYKNNVLSTAEIVNACIRHKVRRLVFSSSAAVYGAGIPPFSEMSQCHPLDPYGISKLASELDIRQACAQHRLEYTILRLFNVYGPGQVCNQRYRNVFGLWMMQHSKGQPITVYGDGAQMRAFTFIEDILPHIWKSSQDHHCANYVLNLGGSMPRSLSMAAAAFSSAVGLPVEAMMLPARHEAKSVWCSTSLVRNLLGDYSETPLAAGLREMWKWFQNQRWSHGWEPGAEIEEGLPEHWQKHNCELAEARSE